MADTMQAEKWPPHGGDVNQADRILQRQRMLRKMSKVESTIRRSLFKTLLSSRSGDFFFKENYF